MPFSAVHWLIPLGVFGVVMNVFSGMRAHRKSPTEPVAPKQESDFKRSSRKLRIACDSCHGVYLKTDP